MTISCPLTIFKAFSLTCDQNDIDIIPLFVSNLKEYLDHQQTLEQRFEHDITDSPKITPIDGTFLKEDTTLDSLQALSGELVNLDESSEDSEEDGSSIRPDGMTSITTYWKPESGKIDILTTSIAQEIAQLTGASLDPDPARKRVKIYGGDFHAALEKLRNLEKLMVSHRCRLFQ